MIIKLGERTGALIVGEGVEAIEEVMTVLQYGAHLLQGFYISKPVDLDECWLSSMNDAIAEVAAHQKDFFWLHIWWTNVKTTKI